MSSYPTNKDPFIKFSPFILTYSSDKLLDCLKKKTLIILTVLRIYLEALTDYINFISFSYSSRYVLYMKAF